MMKDVPTEQAVIDYAMIAREHVLSACTDKIVPRKTVVLETFVDPTVIKVSGERLKRQLFAKFGIKESKSAPIELVSMEKYYVPFIVISARYFLDYYRLSDYTISIDKDVSEVILLNQKIYPTKHQNSPASIKLDGEERLVVEKKGFFMLDKDGKEANLGTLHSAPSEKNPEETIAKYNIRQIDTQADVDFVRKRIVQRPENLNRIVSEVFEVDERVVIYSPIFKLTYVNAYTYQKKSVEFDGVTSTRISDVKHRSRIVQAIKSLARALKRVHHVEQVLRVS